MTNKKASEGTGLMFDNNEDEGGETKRRAVHYTLVPPGDGLYGRLDTLVRAHHPHLDGARIALLWQSGITTDADGHLRLGSCQKVGDAEKELHDYDFKINLNAVAWRTMSEVQQQALLDHELCHAHISVDKRTGGRRYDDRGRVVYRIRKHDIEEFRGVIERHGLYKADLVAFVEAALKGKEGNGHVYSGDDCRRQNSEEGQVLILDGGR